MKSLTNRAWVAFVLIAMAGAHSFAQTFAPSPKPATGETAQLQELTKKIEEQNAKIDMLSQHILKLELQLSNQRPGVMIGEATASSSASAPATSTSASSAAAESSPKSGNGSGHVVARGETLTSIAKMYNVSVSDLQKFNHIDNPLKLMAGQTLQIPPSPIPSPSSSGE
jgi:LysM repeat protein